MDPCPRNHPISGGDALHHRSGNDAQFLRRVLVLLLVLLLLLLLLLLFARQLSLIE
jgi:hypothetical protein